MASTAAASMALNAAGQPWSGGSARAANSVASRCAAATVSIRSASRVVRIVWGQERVRYLDGRARPGKTMALCRALDLDTIKRVAFGMTNFRHWRIRVLLYAGRPDCSKLALVTP